MKNKIGEKNIISFFILAILIVSFSGLISASDSVCSPTISLVNQDPNPAIPDGYITVLFEITDLDGCDGYSVRLNPEYPFSVDTDTNLVSTIESNPYAKNAKNSWMVTYKMRVDSDALDGDYSLKLQVKESSDGYFGGFYTEKEFDVSIQDARTSFDAVIQDYSSSDVSIAIANVGKYTANSVVVRIPEQDYFEVSGVDGQMVGNVDAGDYTTVGFTITQKTTMQTFGQGNVTSRGALPSQNISSSKLKFDIYYTDNLGERRIVNMELALKMSNGNSTVVGGIGTRQKNSSSVWYSSWMLWVLVLGIFVGIYYIYKKNPSKFEFITRLIKKKKSQLDVVPEWIAKSKNKEKK